MKIKIDNKKCLIDFKEGDVIKWKEFFYLIVKNEEHYCLVLLNTFEICDYCEETINDLLIQIFGDEINNVIKVDSELTILGDDYE